MSDSNAIPSPEMTVRFWGVRGSLPSPGSATCRIGGNTSCVEVRYGERLLILDAGTGIRGLGASLKKEFGFRPLEIPILITHTHWDHIQGFPFFTPAYQPDNSITVYGHESSPRGFQKALIQQMEAPYFPVPMRQIPASLRFKVLESREWTIGPFRIRSARLNHPGLCYGFRIETDDGAVAYMPDHEGNGNAFAEPGVSEKEIRAGVVDLLRGVDLAICDSQYTEDEYPSHLSWGHSTVEQAVSLASEAGVALLCLFHHDPDHDDAMVEKIEDHARSLVDALPLPFHVEAAREGMRCHLSRHLRRRA